jgi:hypothetical protein
LSYLSRQAMVSNRSPCSRSAFNDPNGVSLQALFQQLRLRLVNGVTEQCLERFQNSYIQRIAGAID